MLSKNISIYVSILNWNKADATLLCVYSLLKSIVPDEVNFKIFVIDNGSGSDDWLKLLNGLKNTGVILLRNSENVGFSGGHNRIMQKAIDDGIDYVWLVNNDGLVLPNTLLELINIAESDEGCGAVSPVIVRNGDERIIDFCGAYHDWKDLQWYSLENAPNRQSFDNRCLWLIGAALLLRVKALREVGLFDEGFFAYFEDNDLTAKIAFAGWNNRIADQARFLHECPKNRPPYFYYLTDRNGFLFWLRHTPKPFRRFIRLRLLERSLFRANLHLSRNKKELADACLLGYWDGFRNVTGRPNLDREVPWFMTFIRLIISPYHLMHIEKYHSEKISM